MAELTTVRTAVKPHKCDVCRKWIKSGSRYLRHATTPENRGTGWYIMLECSGCATMFGRAGLLEKKNEKAAVSE